MNDKSKELHDLLNDLLMSYQIVANDKDKMKLSRYYKTLNDFIIEYKTLQSNWNSLREYIKEIPEEEFVNTEWYVNVLDKMNELEGIDKK